jgi:hypothetical protein
VGNAARATLLSKGRIGLLGWFGTAYTTVPNKTPTPAVIPMASAPQNVTRITLGMTLAPPTRAAKAPKSPRKISEVPDTKIIRLASGAKAETMRGMTAPATSRSERSLNRTRSQSFRDTEFVAGMSAYGVVSHELVGDLFRERRIEAATNVDCHQFLALALIV